MPSRCRELPTLNLAAIAGRQEHERFLIACLRGLAGARMGALGAVVLGYGINAVAFLQFVLRHACHVVFHGLRRLLHAFRGAAGGSRHRQREALLSLERRLRTIGDSS